MNVGRDFSGRGLRRLLRQSNVLEPARSSVQPWLTHSTTTVAQSWLSLSEACRLLAIVLKFVLGSGFCGQPAWNPCVRVSFRGRSRAACLSWYLLLRPVMAALAPVSDCCRAGLRVARSRVRRGCGGLSTVAARYLLVVGVWMTEDGFY